MFAQNVLQQSASSRLSRRSMLIGLARFTTISAFLSACGTESAKPASPTITTSPTSLVQSPDPSSTSAPVGTLLYKYRGHTLDVFAVAWSPNGKYIASGGFDRTVRLWNAKTGVTMLVYSGHIGQVNSVSWSPDGKSIASSGDGTVQVWNAATGQLIFKRANQVYGTAWSADGKQLAFGNGNSFQLWEIATGKQVASFGIASLITCCPAWSSDGTFIAATGFDDAKKVPTLQIWHVATHSIVFTTNLLNSRRSAVAWSPNSNHLAYANSQSVIESWQMPSGEHHATYPQQQRMAWLCLEWSHDGMYLAAGSYEGLVQIWNAQTTAMTDTRHVNIAVQALAWLPSSYVIASSKGSVVSVWQAV